MMDDNPYVFFFLFFFWVFLLLLFFYYCIQHLSVQLSVVGE